MSGYLGPFPLKLHCQIRHFERGGRFSILYSNNSQTPQRSYCLSVDKYPSREKQSHHGPVEDLDQSEHYITSIFHKLAQSGEDSGWDIRDHHRLAGQLTCLDTVFTIAPLPVRHGQVNL
ncbi:hypothetical protein BsWGS_27548 [Bradybaena similaris]